MSSTINPENRIAQLISEYTGMLPEIVSPNQHLQEDIGLDSLDIISIGMDLENHYSIKINEVNLQKCETVDDLIKLVVNTANAI